MTQLARAFEELPFEILHRVLLSASSPENVYAMIRASPSALRVFSARRERILITFLESSLAPEVFRLMLTILNVPKYEDFQYQQE